MRRSAVSTSSGCARRNCTTGDVLADEQAQASRKEDVLSTLSQMATRFRTRVGESLATVEKHSTPLAGATTPSLEALQAYSAGTKAALAGSSVRALSLFQRAVAIDPDFALAHAQVGFRYGGLGESALARQSLLKAYQLRHRASDVERFYIETLYDRDFTGNLERERRTLETWAASYPRDPSAHTLLAGLALSSTGQHELAIAETDKAIALDPDHTPAYANKAGNQVRLNRLDDALLTVRQAAERKLESATMPLIPYLVAFLRGDDDALARSASVVRTDGPRRGHHRAPGGAGAGSLRPATRGTTDRLRPPSRSRCARVRANGPACSKRVERSGRRSTGMRPPPVRAPARCSRSAGAATWTTPRRSRWPSPATCRKRDDLADDLAREYPESTFVQSMYLPTLRALSSLNAGDPAAAIQALQPASRYDLALGGVGYIAPVRRALPHLRARGWRISPRVSPPRPPPSSSGYSTIRASC